jgi:hypothetical protein
VLRLSSKQASSNLIETLNKQAKGGINSCITKNKTGHHAIQTSTSAGSKGNILHVPFSHPIWDATNSDEKVYTKRNLPIDRYIDARNFEVFLCLSHVKP